eukprot:1055268-Prymnesium_polylepis.1
MGFMKNADTSGALRAARRRARGESAAPPGTSRACGAGESLCGLLGGPAHWQGGVDPKGRRAVAGAGV